MQFDVLANARCAHPDKEGNTPIVSEYLPACHRFKERFTINGTHSFVNLCKK